MRMHLMQCCELRVHASDKNTKNKHKNQNTKSKTKALQYSRLIQIFITIDTLTRQTMQTQIQQKWTLLIQSFVIVDALTAHGQPPSKYK